MACWRIGTLMRWRGRGGMRWHIGVRRVGVGSLCASVCVWRGRVGGWVRIGMLVCVDGSVDRVGYVGFGCVRGRWYVGVYRLALAHGGRVHIGALASGV